jgi:hypothetical protein
MNQRLNDFVYLIAEIKGPVVKINDLMHKMMAKNLDENILFNLKLQNIISIHIMSFSK